MSQHYPEDLKLLVADICAIGSQLHPGTEDDLESLLTWLNPNETNSNHQLRPPALRLKNTIKVFANQPFNSSFSNDGNFEGINGLEKELLILLRQYYIFQVRLNFFFRFDNITTFKDIQRLETYYEFPLKHVFLFQRNAEEWIVERNDLRHYLLNKNNKFKVQLRQRLRTLIMEDDFDLACDVILFLNEAQGALYSRDILLDLMLIKISHFCEKHMENIYGHHFLVMETFNSFILKYWSYFARLLGCPEDDHGLTTIIYNCFEKQFIKIRIKEVFDVFINEYPESKPTILEMKKVLHHTDDFKQLVMQFLSAFEAKILNPSVTTVDALLAYVKSIKSFLLLDPTGKYLNSVVLFVKAYFQERHELVVILLYAILDLQSEEIFQHINLPIDMKRLKILAEELRDPDFNIESKHRAGGHFEKGTESFFNESSSGKAGSDTQLLYQGVLEKFLTWTPEPTDSIPRPFNQSHRNLLDVLTNMFESKEFFVSEFLKLLRKKLLTLKYYKLNRNWSKCLKLMKEKLKNEGSRMPNHESNANEESANSNNMAVMLRDTKNSEDLCKRMHQITDLDPRIFPKFISFLYWDRKLDYKNDTTIDFKLTEVLSHELEKYRNVYKELQPGRTLQLCKDQGVVELELSTRDGYTQKYDVTLEQATAIQLFDGGESNERIFLSLGEVSIQMEIGEERAQRVLQFWIGKSVLYKNHQDLYGSCEGREQEVRAQHQSPHKTSSYSQDSLLSHEQDEQDTKEFSNKIWPFIEGMLRNLGSLKVEKIHALLKVTLPKDLGYDMITHNDLESYLSMFVDDEKLAVLSNKSYKLIN